MTAVIDDAGNRSSESPRKLPLLELVDDVDLMLDGVPDIVVVIAWNVNELLGEIVLLRLFEEDLRCLTERAR